MTMNGTPRSSTPIAIPTPAWPRPNSPLPPHKLAKLANALGVATPLPAIHNVPIITAPPSEASQSPPDPFHRSPSPVASSSSTVTAYSTATSKYLLHVIPPLHLPHESDRRQHQELNPAPPNAPGYHPQFRRGVLVPFYSNYQSQLGAIAKEYALPSTTGMILYLVNSKPTAVHSQITISNEPDDTTELDEPGPRLSEDVWRHLWTRVIRSEPRDDMLLLPSRSPTPNFAPSVSLEPADQSPLRPPNSTNGLDPNAAYPLTPTTPSSATTSDDRSNSRAPFSSSASRASDLDTAETSSLSSASVMMDRAAKRASSLDLPGLHSSSLIPILAKVEFDIDRKRAGWYDAWMRSRKINHAKRAESRHGRRDTDREGNDEEDQKRLPIGLLTGTKESANLISMYPLADASQPEAALSAEGYEPLSDPQEETSGSDSGELEEEMQGAEVNVARIASMHGGRDPLEDVFGADADTWAEMRSTRDSKPASNPNVMGLALTGADLTPDPNSEGLGDGESEVGISIMQETGEVQDLLEKMSHPQVSFSPHSPPHVSSTLQGSSRKHVPPPLVLQPLTGSNFRDLVVPADPSSPGSINLPYLHSPHSPPSGEIERGLTHDKSENNSGDDDLSLDYNHVRSAEESEKRVGALFEELDLGLQIEPSEEFEYDEDDPNDRRRSQYVMKTKLDEIEKAFAQLSPRMLNIDLQEQQTQGFTSASFSISNGLLDAPAASPILRNADIFPPSPTYPGASSRSNRDSDHKHAAWPAVPISALNEAPSLPDKASSNNLPRSAPRLALNGVTTSAPPLFNPAPRTSIEVSPETEQRKRELEEEHPLFQYNTGSQTSLLSVSNTPKSGELGDSEPIIPLSPDPFGRYPSTPDPTGNPQGTTYWKPGNQPSLSIDTSVSASASLPSAEIHTRSDSGATSRFSIDSLQGESVASQLTARQTLTKSAFGVKNLTKLWKLGGGKSSASNPPPTPTASNPPPTPTASTFAGRISLDAPVPPTPLRGRFESASAIGINTPTTPTFGGRRSPQLVPPQPQGHPSASPLQAGAPPRRPSMDALNVPKQSHPVRRSLSISIIVLVQVDRP